MTHTQAQPCYDYQILTIAKETFWLPLHFDSHFEMLPLLQKSIERGEGLGRVNIFLLL